MTTCTQPGCIGTIVDGYCDVCGSPGGAVPFVLAEAASAGSPTLSNEPGAVGLGSEVSPEPASEGLATACAQPGCPGTIVDGYCDVCGSPGGAVPFVPAEAASAGSPTLSNEPGAVGLGSEVSPEPTSEGLATACAQPGCAGTIVDGYCDVCGSPGGAVPFVPAEAAASMGLSAPAAEPGPTASPALTPAPPPVDKEIQARRTPRVKMRRQQLTTQEMANPGAADPGDIDGRKVDAEKVVPAADDIEEVEWERELVEDKPNCAKEYRARVEGTQLPDEVLKAALCEVGKLERISDQSPEFGDIRTRLDTILDLPWSTKTTDWIDIQGSGEVEATLRRLIASAAAQGEAAAADLDKADTAPAGPRHDDTVKMPGVPAVISVGQHQHPQLPEQHVLRPEAAQTPAEKRHFGSLALAATALAALIIGALSFAVSKDGGVTGQSVRTVPPTASATVTEPTSEPTIQLNDLADTGRPFQTVRIHGTYHGGANTFLRVQRWEAGKWLAFPLPTKTDQSGQFTAYVEFGQPGRYRLRVLHPGTHLTSKTFVLVVKG